MWFDKEDERAVFGDIRCVDQILGDGRALKVEPCAVMDFRELPFASGTFRLVVFDPPHFTRAGPQSYMRAKYGVLGENWRDDLARGFKECFRVLEPEGVLIFKWNETMVKVCEVLALTSERPLFGHKSGKREKTHWLTFLKPARDPLV